MIRPAQLVIGVLVVATLAALALDQRLKEQPAFVRRIHVNRSFSPNGDRFRDTARIRFAITRPDVVSVAIVDARGKVVRRLATDRPAPAGRTLRFRWDGRTDAGRPAPPGVYRARVTLRRRGRSIVLLQRIRLSARAPWAGAGEGSPKSP